MEKNIITIKRKPRKRINRRADGSGIVRVNDEGITAVEKLLSNVDDNVNIIDVVSQMLVYAAENTEIQIVDEEEEQQWQK